METKIYLDNSATTKVSDQVLDAVLPWLRDGYGNASSVYTLGRKSAMALSNARTECSKLLGAETSEIIFTSGGTEGNNFALKQSAMLMKEKGKNHIISTQIEHPSVLECLKRLEKEGFRITRLPVDENGIVSTEKLKTAITPDTGLVSVMYVNNELGTIEPVSEIGEICRQEGIIFHTDAVQAVGNVPVDVKALNVDLLTLSGHKIHGLKGTGLIYINKRLSLTPFIEGGKQELGKRAGTENVPGIVGLSVALRNAVENLPEKNRKLSLLRNALKKGLSEISGAYINGGEGCVNNILNVSFEDIESEALILQLDLKGIAVSGGSACASGAIEPSHVLTATGLDKLRAKGSIRISMSEYTTHEEIEEFLRILPETVEKLRSLRG